MLIPNYLYTVGFHISCSSMVFLLLHCILTVIISCEVSDWRDSWRFLQVVSSWHLIFISQTQNCDDLDFVPLFFLTCPGQWLTLTLPTLPGMKYYYNSLCCQIAKGETDGGLNHICFCISNLHKNPEKYTKSKLYSWK